MDAELLTEEMVAELQQDIKQVMEAAEKERTGQAELNRFEQGMRRALNRFGAKLTQRQIEQAGQKHEKGPRGCGQCGKPMRNVKRARLVVQSIFGSLRVHRTKYACAECERTEYPLDDHFGWQPHHFTPTAKEWVCLMCQEHAYEGSVEILERVSGILGTAETFRDVVQECAGQLLEQREAVVRMVNETEAPLPQGEPLTKWMLVGVDGCQVLKSGEGVGKRKKAKTGRKRRLKGKRRKTAECSRERGMEAKVGMVGALDPKAQEDDRVKQKSYVTTMEDVEAFTDFMFCESAARGVLKAERVVVMGDGASWIWKRIAPLFTKDRRIEILDWFHLKTKVEETAEALYGPKENWPTRNWLQQQMDKLWVGNPVGVLRALHEQRRKWEKRQRGRETVLPMITALERYLLDNQTRMEYPRYRRLGLPIGTGEVESACKQLVDARMKRSGMQWRKGSAQTILHLRAEFKSQRWDQDWENLRAVA